MYKQLNYEHKFFNMFKIKGKIIEIKYAIELINLFVLHAKSNSKIKLKTTMKMNKLAVYMYDLC